VRRKRWASCAGNIKKVYFKNEKKPICIKIFIHSLKYIFNFVHEVRQKILISFIVRSEPKKFENHCRRHSELNIVSDTWEPSIAKG
jgi:hypothetical protein